MVGSTSLGLASGAVQPEHELSDGTLPQRPFANHGLEAVQRVRDSPQGEFRLGQILHGAEARLVQTGRLDPGERPRGQLTECRTAPQYEGLTEGPRGGFGLAPLGCSPGLRHQPIEPAGVHRFVAGHQEVPVVAGFDINHDQPLAQPPDQASERRRGSGGGVLTPHHVDERIGGDPCVPGEGQRQQDGSWLQAADRLGPRRVAAFATGQIDLSAVLFDKELHAARMRSWFADNPETDPNKLADQIREGYAVLMEAIATIPADQPIAYYAGVRPIVADLMS